MTIDASIPLRAAVPFSLSEIMERVERVKGMQSQRERQQWEIEQAKAETERTGNARNSLAQLILSQSPDMPGSQAGGGPMTEPMPNAQPSTLADFAQYGMNPDAAGAVTGGSPAGPPSPRPGSEAWRQYVQYDPEGAVDFRASTAEWTKDTFDQARELNESAMQILGSVYDQVSFGRAKNKARALYGRFGLNLDDFGLPDQYSPELVRSLQLEGMQTREQLETIRRERETDWNIEDRQQDNERLDRREEDLGQDREARRAEVRRNNERRDATARRGQDLGASRARSGSVPRNSRRAEARPTATDAQGNKVEWNGSAWVPVR